MEKQQMRFLPLAGVAAVLLWAVAILTIDGVRPTEVTSPETILAFYQEHGSTVEMAIYGYMLGAVLFLVFIGTLWNRLRDAEGGAGGIAPIAFAAGIATSICMLVMYGSDMEAARDHGKYGLTASTAEAYYFFGDFWWVGAMLMSAILLGTTGLIAIRTGTFPRWYGWASIVLAIPLLLPPIGNSVMFFLFPLWVIATAVLLAKRATRTANVHAPSAIPGVTAESTA